jgi:hypothetical protein
MSKITSINPASLPGEPAVATKLLRAVIAKSLLEILFVCGVATFAAFSHFSPWLRGAIDVADQTRVAGWVHDPLAPHEAIEVQLFIDDHFVAAQYADEPRHDLVVSGAASKPQHGFSFALAGLALAAGQHTAQVYAVRKAAGANKALLPLARTAVTFEVRR